MNVIQKLTLRHMLLNKRRTLVTVLGIVISVAMLTAVSTFTGSFMDLARRDTPVSYTHLDVYKRQPWNEEREEGEGFVLPSRPETFREHLLFQLSALPLQEGVRRLCIYLIHSLSPRGYLTESEGEIAALTGESLSAVRQAVKIVQSLSPTGVGARDLVQCLLLQMEAKKITHPAPVAIVRDHLQDLARGHYGVIRKKLGLSAEETERWCRLILSLIHI